MRRCMSNRIGRSSGIRPILILTFVLLALNAWRMSAAVSLLQPPPWTNEPPCGSSDPRVFSDPTLCMKVLDALRLPPLNREGEPLLRASAPSHLEGEEARSYRAFFVLAPNTNPYPFVVDASASAPRDSDFFFTWKYYEGLGDYGVLAGPTQSPYYTNALSNPIGFDSRDLLVVADDTAGRDNVWFGVVVLTPETATDAMIEWLDSHFRRHRGRVQRRLVPPLREAKARFAAAQTEAGKNRLSTFLRRLKLTRFPLTRDEARVFRILSQTIIDTAAD